MLPPVQKRFDNVWRQQRQPQQCPEIPALDPLRRRHLAD
jgi:hypothetical protein